MSKLLVIGLGNPGKSYENNRHNIGFMLIDAILNNIYKQQFSEKFNGLMQIIEIAKIDLIKSSNIQNVKHLIMFKPLTYMNNSGLAISKLVNFYKLSINNVIVIHDDLDLELGRLKVKLGGGSGGHNGLKSMDIHIGNGYYRLRLGIGHPGNSNQVSDYVLSNFSQAEFEKIKLIQKHIISSMHLLLNKEMDKFISSINSYKIENIQ